MVDIHEQVWICTEWDGYIIWGKGIHGENVVEMYTIFDDFIRINESGIKKNYMYQFCYYIIIFV